MIDDITLKGLNTLLNIIFGSVLLVVFLLILLIKTDNYEDSGEVQD